MKTGREAKRGGGEEVDGAMQMGREAKRGGGGAFFVGEEVDGVVSFQKKWFTENRFQSNGNRTPHYIFCECRHLGGVKKRGMYSTVMIREGGSSDMFKFGVCMGCDLDTVVFLEFNGPADILEELYRFGDNGEPADGSADARTLYYNCQLSPYLTSNVVNFHDSNNVFEGQNSHWDEDSHQKNQSRKRTTKGNGKAGQKRRKPNEKEVYFVNLVHSPVEGKYCHRRIYPDTTDPKDDCFCFSTLGPDVLLEGIIPQDVYHSSHNMLTTDDLCLPAEATLPRGQAKSVLQHQRGDFIVVAQDGICSDRIKGRVMETSEGKYLSETDLFSVPYLCEATVGSKYAMVTREGLLKLGEQSGCLAVEQFDELLCHLSTGDIGGYVVTDYRVPVIVKGGLQEEMWEAPSATWIASYDGETLPELVFEDHVSADWMSETRSHMRIAGMKFSEVSKQFGDGKIHIMAGGGKLMPIYSVSYNLCDAVHGIYSKQGGYRNRGVSVCSGHNTYNKIRRCNRPLDNPICGPSNKGRVDYWRNYFRNPHAIVATNPVINHLTNMAIHMGEYLHPAYTRLTQTSFSLPANSIHRSICSNGILNMGNEDTLFFANTNHSDPHDFLKENQQIACISALESQNRKGRSSWNQWEREMLLGWKRRFGGFGRHTTCSYANVETFPETWEVYQFFVMDGLGMAARLGPGVVHSFFGGHFCHNTAVTLAINDEGKVLTKHPNHYLMAWGGS